MDREQLQAYLRERMPDHVDLEVIDDPWRIAGGMSRETWFADMRYEVDGEVVTQRLTIRADHPNGSVVPVPLSWEFNVLECLQRTDVPAAKPYWYEQDEKWIGRAPFYVRENIAGTGSFGKLFVDGAEKKRAAVGRRFAELLAVVHTADWETAGFGGFMQVPADAPECALLELAKYRRHYEANRFEPKPVMAELLSWLDRNAPSSVQRISLIWGDVGLGNFIFEGDEIVALTDWEQSHLGDPMKDWASALWRGADSLLSKEEMFRIYEDASGLTVDLDAIAYYLAFIDALYICTSHPVINEVLNGRVDDVTFARLGLGIPFYCLNDGFARITV